MRIAERMKDLGSEMAFEVLAKAKALEEQGKDIVHLEIGEPDFDTPSHIIEAGIKAIREGYTHYGPTAGLPDLRASIARNIRETRGIDIDPGRVLVTPGGKPIIFFTALALVQDGDEVMYPDPGFPIYESMIRFLGARPVPIRLREEEGCHLDLEDLDDSIFEDVGVQDFAKTQIAKLRKDEQKLIASKIKNEEITGRQLYADVVKNLRNLDSDSSLNEDQKSFIRAEVIHNVHRDKPAENIIKREKMRIEMADKGEIPNVITDEIMQAYIDETHKYAKKVIEMEANKIEFANPKLVAQLGLGLVQVWNAIDELRERMA